MRPRLAHPVFAVAVDAGTDDNPLRVSGAESIVSPGWQGFGVALDLQMVRTRYR